MYCNVRTINIDNFFCSQSEVLNEKHFSDCIIKYIKTALNNVFFFKSDTLYFAKVQTKTWFQEVYDFYHRRESNIYIITIILTTSHDVTYERPAEGPWRYTIYYKSELIFILLALPKTAANPAEAVTRDKTGR